MIFLVRAASERDGPATRREILNTLEHEPGINKSELARRLHLSWGAIFHHVRLLETDGHLVRKNLYGWMGLYSAQTPRMGMLVRPLLRDQDTIALLQLLQRHAGLRLQDVARLSPLTRKQIRRRLDHLHTAGLVDRSEGIQGKFTVRHEMLDLTRRQTGIDLNDYSGPS
jgi:predicted ArsR family transcriptional regulator